MTNYANQINVKQINNGTSASSSTYHRGDNTWAATSGAGVLIPLATATASNTSALIFNGNVFSSTYYQYLFVFNQILPVTNTTNLQCQLGTGAGPTFISANYNWETNMIVGGSNGSTNNTSDAQVSISGTHGTYQINSTNGNMSGMMLISGPNGSSVAADAIGMIHFMSTSTTYPVALLTSWFQPAAVFTAIKFNMSSGNIASGVVDIYGILPG